MTSDEQLQLKVDVTRYLDIDVVTVTGEIDISTIEQLDVALMFSTAPRLVLDMRGVDFIGSDGLSTLLKARARFDGPDGVRLVVRDPGPVLHVLEIMDLTDRFEIDRVSSGP